MFVTMSANLSAYGEKYIHLFVQLNCNFSVFSFESEYVRSLSAKNLLVWDKNLRRGSVGTNFNAANLNDNNKSVRESTFLFRP